MYKFIPAAAAALALSVTFAALPASAALHYTSLGNTNFDLGVDVSQVPLNAGAVNAYIAGLDPTAQAIITGSCAHYVDTPNAARAQATVDFCGLVGNPDTGATVTLAYAPQTVAPVVQSAAAPTQYSLDSTSPDWPNSND